MALQSWRQEISECFSNETCKKRIFKKIKSAAADLGFERCAYTLYIPVPISRPQVYQVDDFPEEWQKRYSLADYHHIDPSVAHCRKSERPVVWNDELFASAPELWREAQSHGLKVGWSQANQNTGSLRGVLTLVRSSVPLAEAELKVSEPLMSFLASASYEAMGRAMKALHGTHQKAFLTSRELETLKWTADGKTMGDIAQILDVSENTVRFHLKNATAKLQSPNKTAAAVKAALLGWLD
ncbi:autoinducer binding domain-containing protein [Acidovorax sp. NCPPB 3576]|uniref:autoinducer binding domain-containing protein n=1 Tax=Acidovorax sp. NCPPB 3576 TaxID=2940488 RepID=UPI00234BC08C|nr:autoinducer binding domain-containing protein [Acidovorax sp. NCPPB 3576]WCM90271.1 autoinducer binding domain-containing protein [Acidovorax sp. NCPPB 3576]